MTLKVAIVGSGPSGFYAADAVVRACDDCEVDIIERLPVPYGLIRAGVAPDHQTTKNVSRNFEKTAQRDNVRFYGNVELDRDISLAELRQLYDAVILAVGAPHDRDLGIPGADKEGVIGSAAFVGWYNGHPDFRDLSPPLDTKSAVIIGNGNVALDIARLLAKTPAELAVTDITSYAAEAIADSPLTDIYVVGRRGPAEAKFTLVELREMGTLDNAVPVIDPAQLPETIDTEMSDRDRRVAERNLGVMRDFLALEPKAGGKRVHFVFYASPVEIVGDARVTGVTFERTVVGSDGSARGTGETFTLECGLVVPAIGYRALPIGGVDFDARRGVVPNEDGRVEKGLYVVGWVKRGPTGVIATNRPDGKQAAEMLLADVAPGDRPGRRGLEAALAAAGCRWVTFEDWKRIEAAEVAAATAGAPRRKLTSVADLLAALD